MFAPLVLIAALSNVSNEATVLGSQLFFFSRLAHAAIYISGIPKIRPIPFLVGIAGTIMIFASLMGWIA